MILELNFWHQTEYNKGKFTMFKFFWLSLYAEKFMKIWFTFFLSFHSFKCTVSKILYFPFRRCFCFPLWVTLSRKYNRTNCPKQLFFKMFFHSLELAASIHYRRFGFYFSFIFPIHFRHWLDDSIEYQSHRTVSLTRVFNRSSNFVHKCALYYITYYTVYRYMRKI